MKLPTLMTREPVVDPLTFLPRRDPAFVKADREEADAFAELHDLEDGGEAPLRRCASALAEHRRLRARRAAGDEDITEKTVEAARRECEQAEADGELHEGRLALARERVERAKAAKKEAFDAALLACGERLRAEIGTRRTEVARILGAGRRLAKEIAKLQDAAERAAPWASEEAKRHGHAFGISRGVIPLFLLHDNFAQYGGLPGTWDFVCRAAGFPGSIDEEKS